MAALLVLCLVGYLAVVAVNDARYPPDKPVRELFSALAARDIDRAAALASCAAPGCRGAALAEGYQPPTNVAIGEATYGDPTDDTRRPDKSIAYVPVEYSLPGGRHSVTMRVQRSGEGLARPFQILDGATGRLDVTTTHVEKIRVGGAVVPLAEQGADRGLTVLPGTYAVQVSDSDPLFAPVGGPVRVDVRATADDQARPDPIRLDVQVRPEIVGQVRGQVAAYLAECAKQTTLDPVGCPLDVPGISIGADDVQWSVVRLPDIAVVPADDAPSGGGPVAVRTVAPGEASVTYSAFISVGGDRQTITRQVPIEVGGRVDIDPDETGKVTWSR